MGLKSSLAFSDIEVNVNRLDALVGRIQTAFQEYASMTDTPDEVADPLIPAAMPAEDPTMPATMPAEGSTEPRIPPATTAQLTDAFVILCNAHNDLVRLWKKEQSRRRRAAIQMK